MTLTPPPFDEELEVVLAQATASGLTASLTPDRIGASRATTTPSIAQIIGNRPIGHDEHLIPAGPGGGERTISVLSRRDRTPGGPGFYFIHGGGMVGGDRFTGIEVVLEWVELMDAVAISMDYRLAPENPDPAPIDDCYAGLIWAAAHADELGFDPTRLILVGQSAGGGLAAGVALRARDHGGPTIAAQVLIYPMLDDRNDTISSRQMDGIGVWDRLSNETGWDALLGERRKTDAVSIYAAPARATDLSRLPPAFIDVGSAEVFRDEDVAYASTIWAAGGVAELHVWPGGFHAFDLTAPDAVLSKAMRETRTAWVRRMVKA